MQCLHRKSPILNSYVLRLQIGLFQNQTTSPHINNIFVNNRGNSLASALLVWNKLLVTIALLPLLKTNTLLLAQVTIN